MLDLLFGQAGVIAALIGLAAVLLGFARKSGRDAEKARQAKRDAQARSEQDDLIREARDARHGARSTYDDLMSDDDGYKRD